MTCPYCKAPLQPGSVPSGPQECRICNRTFEATFFTPGETHQPVIEVAQAGVAVSSPCANHERNAAVASCQRCGHFICELCKIDDKKQILCVNCFNRLDGEGALEASVTSFRNYTGLTWFCAMSPFVMSLAAFPVTAMSLYFGVKAFRQRKALGLSSGIISIGLAMFLGLAATVGCLALIVAFIVGISALSP